MHQRRTAGRPESPACDRHAQPGMKALGSESAAESERGEVDVESKTGAGKTCELVD